MGIARQQRHPNFPARYRCYIKLASSAPVDFDVRGPRLDCVMPPEAEAGLVGSELVETRPPPDAGGAAVRADDPTRADLSGADLNAVALIGRRPDTPQHFYAVSCGLIREQRVQRRAADGQPRALWEIR